jgi:integrase
LSNSSINGTLRHLAQILETACDYGLISSNPAAGKRRRLKTSRPARPWIEPHQLKPFLEAPTGVGRVLLWILVATGVRIEEALSVRWRDIDLGTGHLYVRKSKTPKGIRRIPLPPALREELTLWRASTGHTGPDDFVIHTATGHAHNPSNLRRDVLAPAVKAADVELAKLGILPIGHITFHGLRRTFASLRSYGDKSHRQTADLLGHEDVRFTLNVYAQSGLDPDEMLPPVRKAFDWALDWAAMGSNEPLTVPSEATIAA